MREIKSSAASRVTEWDGVEVVVLPRERHPSSALNSTLQ